MPTGVVKAWRADKGFGFLEQDSGGDDLFVHVYDLLGTASLNPGDHVKFKLGNYRGKTKAVNCQVTQCAPKPAPVESTLDRDAAFPSPNRDASVDLFMRDAGNPDQGFITATTRFITYSSLGCPFLVVSEQQLVQNVPAPSEYEFSQLAQLVKAYIEGCEARRAVFLADFEGEMIGHGGEITLAQFHATYAMDNLTPNKGGVSCRASHSMGLLIDLRSLSCSRLVKHIMESLNITKLMWGADGDVQSLMYQAVPLRLDIRPASIVDVQLAFSSSNAQRVGMKSVLARLPQTFSAHLPAKEQIDWDSSHSLNRRALIFPLPHQTATYAMDDLHRIEAILLSQNPPRSYNDALVDTEWVLAAIRNDPCGLAQLEANFTRMCSRVGRKQTVCAVAIVRHLVSLQVRGTNLGSGVGTFNVNEVADRARKHLLDARVSVALDLSFDGDTNDLENSLKLNDVSDLCPLPHPASEHVDAGPTNDPSIEGYRSKAGSGLCIMLSLFVALMTVKVLHSIQR